MSAIDTLGAIARGGQPAGLLQGCRLAEGDAEAYGIEGVVARFRAAPVDLSAARTVDGGGTIAAVAGETVLVADVYGANVARIWRIGPDAPPAAEPRIDVAFDPDMAQARGDVFAVAGDFPAVDPTVVDRIVAAMRAEIARWTVGAMPASRARAFLIRVAAEGERAVALFAVHSLAAGPRRGAGFELAALVLDGEARLVRGAAAEERWTPRIGA